MDRSTVKYYGELSGAVMVKLALLAGAYFSGTGLDRHFHCFPLFTFILLVAAGGLGIWWIVYVATRSDTKS